MQTSRRFFETVFVITLGALLIGGVLFVAGQAAGLLAGQNGWLEFFNTTIKPPMCIAASVCALAGFLLSYRRPKEQVQRRQEAQSR
ncbi:hypothetical protein [Pseudarthrobacter phenanthrenivorans]|jgi:hypothetical protein|uniref:Uncharacterized protein n=1 Tax=Pseudarthrobacter phenanthrenivorans TaxID=361575 RepID=A0A0B4DN84_PSEPS|nr:hypothetical protein [Pseudarthrobacter phenanthrenivorans]KIC65875.1 hypothetical protein RM50_14285 [Pseudarthrobacter phenanthrenivorans]